MATVRLNGGDLYYEVHGDGPPIVFVHGRGGNHLSWWQQVPRFRDRYTCVVYDAPACGRSEHPDGDWSYVDTLAGLLDHLELGQVALVAQSMGGGAALRYALDHPERVRALVMSGTSGPIDLDDGPPEITAWWDAAPARGAELRSRGIHPACGERHAAPCPSTV